MAVHALVLSLSLLSSSSPHPGLTAAQGLDVEYAQRALESVAGIPNVPALRIAALRSEVGALASALDFEAALARVLGEVRSVGQSARPAASRSTAGVVSYEEAAQSDPGLVASIIAWGLDRPVPWERDCSCCYPVCPADHWCIKQADKRYLACAGYSVRQHLKFAIIDHPWLSLLCIVLLVVLASQLTVGGRARGRARAPREKSVGSSR